MKIAYVISESYSINKFNGIRMQADIWADELDHNGHEVVRVNPWGKYDWSSMDIIHIFGPCEFLLNFVSSLSRINDRIVFSPIIDTIKSVGKYNLASHWGCSKLRLSSPNYNIRKASKYIKLWISRSEYESMYINRGYSIPKEKIELVPLSFRIPLISDYPQKEKFCLHVSNITDGRKNVMRLMQAAIKYNFRLVLAGGVGSEYEYAPFKRIITKHDNISYLGRVTDEELRRLYTQAKVFALPSINEGVGMVAVEAASYGCDIVITEKGGPKEYYGDLAFIVNPYDVEEIGQAVLKAMDCNSFQPTLMKNIQDKYNVNVCTNMLVDAYKSILT